MMPSLLVLKAKEDAENELAREKNSHRSYKKECQALRADNQALKSRVNSMLVSKCASCTIKYCHSVAYNITVMYMHVLY